MDFSHLFPMFESPNELLDVRLNDSGSSDVSFEEFEFLFNNSDAISVRDFSEAIAEPTPSLTTRQRLKKLRETVLSLSNRDRAVALFIAESVRTRATIFVSIIPVFRQQIFNKTNSAIGIHRVVCNMEQDLIQSLEGVPDLHLKLWKAECLQVYSDLLLCDNPPTILEDNMHFPLPPEDLQFADETLAFNSIVEIEERMQQEKDLITSSTGIIKEHSEILRQSKAKLKYYTLLKEDFI